ncbi:HIRAN domain-containing protein [Sphingopyxis macrogoltabida]|uniref:HIRAN domain-containing protein n=1 Tax=Sphingopyxis macrogoltabida TaxID=33050 RepID=A0A0N7GTA0_SPHMC|nr:HIRAN domain-containing protein [Sphingopyxis macrogoltabida]ALH82931.1 hypothetical protein AN936_22010 [Sphingopyxis macrogoltabida]
MPAQITLPIVGTRFPNKDPKEPTRQFALELCEPGEEVTLRLDPANKHDEHAIEVRNSRDMMMGYIPANRAVYVGMQIRRSSAAAIFQGRTERGGFIRIAFDGDKPVLPKDPADQSTADDFQPDPEYPDDWGA